MFCFTRYCALLGLLSLGLSVPPASAQLADFAADFENVDPMSPTAVSDLGYIVFGNVFDLDFNFIYGYGTFPAPNLTGGFSEIATDVGAGAASLNIFSDYLNGDHGNMRIIEANVFREGMPSAADVGRTVEYSFDYRRAADPFGPGGASGITQTFVFVRVIDQFNNFALIDQFDFETTDATEEFQNGSLSIEIIPAYQGRFFQYGFRSFATNFEPSGIYYDNIQFGDPVKFVLGDVNGDGVVNLSDVAPFVNLLSTGGFLPAADINMDGLVNLSDVAPFVQLLSGG